jgi:hypothetical protein
MAAGLFQELWGLDVQDVAQYLEQDCDLPFEQSELYVVADGHNQIDTTRRVSQFRKIRDVALCDLVEPLVSEMSKGDPVLDYSLVRNDVTHIRYEKGGFFTKHQDYVSVTSNMVEEFSMLVCVTPKQFVKSQQGGKTVIHTNQGRFLSDTTTTPGCALVFRKDLEHESTVLEEGEKHIIMLNLWGMRKDTGGVLIVNFEGCEGEREAATKEGALRKLAHDMSYVIPLAEARQSRKLAEHIDSQESFGKQIIYFTCYDANYDGFGTIFRILQRMYVSSQEVELQADLIRAYGLECQHIFVAAEDAGDSTSKAKPEDQHEYPSSDQITQNISISMMNGSVHSFEAFPTDTIKDLKQRLKKATGKSGLALFAEDSTLPLNDKSTLESCGLPLGLTALKQTTKVDEYRLLGVDDTQVTHLAFSMSDEAPVDEDGSDVILCESSARARVVSEAAKAAELPFVRFEVLLVEGELSISGDTCRPCRHKFKMDPAFISIGDLGNVLGLGSVSSAWEGGGTWWEAEQTWPGHRNPDNPRLYNLQSVLKPGLNAMSVMEYVFGDCDSQMEDEDISELVQKTDFGKISNAMQTHPEFPANTNPFFHIDADGQTSFTSEQATCTSAYLKSILFIDQLKAQIGQVPWQFPQSSKSRQETLCNERVYGHVNILMASGLVRLSESGQASDREGRHEMLERIYRGSKDDQDEEDEDSEWVGW